MTTKNSFQQIVPTPEILEALREVYNYINEQGIKGNLSTALTNRDSTANILKSFYEEDEYGFFNHKTDKLL